jgi:hypothetical protein
MTFSRRLKRFFNRQNIYLVDENNFNELIRKHLGKDQIIICEICHKNMSLQEVEGWYFDNAENFHFFCNDRNCFAVFEGGVHGN